MSHISVLLHETVDGVLAGRDTGIYVDATFGRGGHTRLLLSKLDQNARVYAFDKDPQALEVAAELKQKDAHFNKLFEKHNDLDDVIVKLEESHADQFEIEAKKKEKLKLKDEIYAVIVKYKSEK